MLMRLLFIFIDANITNANTAHDVISKDLKYIESWADQWLVKFSTTKTKTMNVSLKQEQVEHSSLCV